MCMCANALIMKKLEQYAFERKSKLQFKKYLRKHLFIRLLEIFRSK